MAHLSIRNIGPIKNIDIDLNRINVFLGPQSSGKSTIAKILSFCQWLQKDAVIRQSIWHINEDFVNQYFVEYHNISSYLTKELSEFHYTGRCINIDYAKGKMTVTESGGVRDAAVSKNAYIPSERNIIGIPQSLSMDLPTNYLRSFLSDWMSIRDKFTRKDSVKLMGLNVSYFYNEAGADDMIMIDNQPEHPIPLSQASSGLQATTPLYVYFKYLTEWIYSHEENRSPQRLKQIREGSARGAILAEIPVPVKTPQDNEQVESLAKRLSALSHLDFSKEPLLQHLRDIEKRISRPSFSNIIIEEPEQNLFPETQASLVYSMLEMMNFERDNLTITTHSPFIVYALNNCMMAYLTGIKKQKELPRLKFSKASWVDPSIVSVWELRDGQLKAPDKEVNQTIQDSDGLIRNNYFDRVMKSLMVDFKNILSVDKS